MICDFTKKEINCINAALDFIIPFFENEVKKTSGTLDELENMAVLCQLKLISNKIKEIMGNNA